jgi:hypothetical protein
MHYLSLITAQLWLTAPGGDCLAWLKVSLDEERRARRNFCHFTYIHLLSYKDHTVDITVPAD